MTSRNSIFVQIAAYRDRQLKHTLKDLLEKASRPENLKICICWQHSKADDWDNLDEYKNDDRFIILDVNHEESKGVCWARNMVQNAYTDQDYTLQLDSHHRFVENWDEILIGMIEDLRHKGYKKPLLTAYLPSFDPENDPAGRAKEPWWMTFDRFIPEGAVFFLPASIQNWTNLDSPIPARFYSAHFCFAPGSFCKEVSHDPNYYFHGEEISIAVRAYTWGYDLFHPHRIVCWHEYTRKGRTKHWDDDSSWVEKNNDSHKRNRKLFGMDGEISDIDFGKYGFGKVRTLEDYQAYSGLNFKKRAVQKYTIDNKYPPNPKYDNLEDYEKSFLGLFKHCIDIYPSQCKHNDYDFWVVSFENKNGETIYRKDADKSELIRIKNDPDGYYKIWREFICDGKPYKWIVWMHSKSAGWVDKYEGVL